MSNRVLVLSPYDAMSHRLWHEGIVKHFPELDFTVVTLPPRHFAWRHRGNSLTLAFDDRLDQDFDLLLATSMTDLSALKGLQPKLTRVPTILYFHENQFAYPEGKNAQGQLERQITSIYSALAAERLVFNSAFNRDTFIRGAGQLLDKMPDHVPIGIIAGLMEKSEILPVPLDDEIFRSDHRDGFTILWNHRWEYDKGLLDLQEIIVGLLASDLSFTMHLVGQQFRDIPQIMQENVDLLAENGKLGVTGFIESRQDYLDLLATCRVVLSTAHHEFQGLSVLEAVAAGCVPVVPARLVYPELFSSQNCYKDSGDAVLRIEALAGQKQSPPDMRRFSWRQQRSAWAQLFALLLEG